jgi:hypothetical protein
MDVQLASRSSWSSLYDSAGYTYGGCRRKRQVKTNEWMEFIRCGRRSKGRNSRVSGLCVSNIFDEYIKSIASEYLAHESVSVGFLNDIFCAIGLVNASWIHTHICRDVKRRGSRNFLLDFTALELGPQRRRQPPLQVIGSGERHSGPLSCLSTMTRWNVRPPPTTSSQICCRISRGSVSRGHFEPTLSSGTGIGDEGLVSGVRPAKSIWALGKGPRTSGSLQRLRLETGLVSPKRLKGRLGRIRDSNLRMAKGLWRGEQNFEVGC